MTGTPKKRVHPATAARNADARRAALLRQRAIAELMVSGITGARDISAKLQIPLRTIYRDLQVIEREFRASIVNVIESRRGLQLSQIDAAKTALWPKVQKGHIMAVAPYVSLLAREAKLLGLDAPIALDIQWRLPLEAAGVDAHAIYGAVVGVLLDGLRGGNPPATLAIPELDVLDFSPLDDFGRRGDERDDADDRDEGEPEDA